MSLFYRRYFTCLTHKISLPKRLRAAALSGLTKISPENFKTNLDLKTLAASCDVKLLLISFFYVFKQCSLSHMLGML